MPRRCGDYLDPYLTIHSISTLGTLIRLRGIFIFIFTILERIICINKVIHFNRGDPEIITAVPSIGHINYRPSRFK